MCVCIGESRFIGGFADAQMFEFPLAAYETATDLSERIGASYMVEEHGNQLCPADESFHFAFCLVFCDQMRKFWYEESDEVVD